MPLISTSRSELVTNAIIESCDWPFTVMRWHRRARRMDCCGRTCKWLVLGHSTVAHEAMTRRKLVAELLQDHRAALSYFLDRRRMPDLSFLRDLQRALFYWLLCRLCLVRVNAVMRRIIHPALHGKQTRAVGAQYDMIDLFHATDLGLESQTSGL